MDDYEMSIMDDHAALDTENCYPVRRMTTIRNLSNLYTENIKHHHRVECFCVEVQETPVAFHVADMLHFAVVWS